MLDKKVFNSIEELFKYRLHKNRPHKHNGKQAFEKQFNDELEKVLKKALTELGFDVISIAREFNLLYGRCDFVVELQDDKYVIIESKAKNSKSTDKTDDLRFCYSVGQLQTYRTIFNIQYKIPKENVYLMLATNYDSLLVHSLLGAENLDIGYLIYNEMGVKYYGKKI